MTSFHQNIRPPECDFGWALGQNWFLRIPQEWLESGRNQWGMIKTSRTAISAEMCRNMEQSLELAWTNWVGVMGQQIVWLYLLPMDLAQASGGAQQRAL